MEQNCGIYKWQNTQTGKAYIGQSTKLYERKLAFTNFNNYRYAGRKINEARRKFKNPYYWEYSVLTYCDPQDLNKEEKRFIEIYDSINNGYNTLPGGSSEKIIIDHFEPYYKYMDFERGSRFLMEIGKNIFFS